MGSNTLQRHFQEYIQYSEIKHLAYNIAALQQSKGFHTLAVMSCFPGEGKTLLCAALAMAYAEACQKKVLIVDTTSRQDQNSLSIGACVNGSSPLVEIKPLTEISRVGVAAGPSAESPSVLESAPLPPSAVPPRARNGHFSSLKQLTDGPPENYGLVLIDTVPLQARNKGNMDPLFVARLCGASVLVVSKTFLNASNMNKFLDIVKDPTLHMLGVISNEGRDR